MSAFPLRFLTPFAKHFSRRCGTPPRLGYGIRQPARFPHRPFGGRKLRFPPSLRSLPPLLGLRPTTKVAIPLGTPAALLPQIRKLASVEKPCPLSRPRTSSPTPFALATKRNLCPLRCGGLSQGLPLTFINK